MSSQKKVTESSHYLDLRDHTIRGPTKRCICIYILHLTYLKEACLAKPVYSHSHDRGQADLPTVSEDLRSSEQLHRACQVTGVYIGATTSSMSCNTCLHRTNYTQVAGIFIGATTPSMSCNRCLKLKKKYKHLSTASEDLLRSSEQLHRACQVTGVYIGTTKPSMSGNRCLHRSNYTEHVM